MKIRYEFVTGTVEIEVIEEWGNVLIDLDRQEYNNDHKETRRHTTLNNRIEEGEWLAVEDADITAMFADEPNDKRVKQAIARLKPKQRELINAVCFEGVTVNEYAAREGVDQSAISHRLQTVYKNIKKLL
ncbi:MAG: sigma-70 family RNA polymerase sigma factor [Spirochaetales bacterium]|jgi:RNA polymerase sigma factor (sigma-70 family)|nr:sigma-70 family RNA polymerase sigma factor [Spirochaetales bacterium]